MISQERFNRFVSEYNRDYIQLLTRASRHDYDGLLFSFISLKDQREAIQAMHDTEKYTYQVVPHPFPFRNNELLRELAFDHDQVRNIFGFLDHVQTTQGKPFEDCLAEGKTICD